MMFYKDGSVFVEKSDQCSTCKNFTSGVACPLLQALGTGVVSFDGTLYVTNCGFYEEFVRSLKLVSNDKKDSPKNKKK